MAPGSSSRPSTRDRALCCRRSSCLTVRAVSTSRDQIFSFMFAQAIQAWRDSTGFGRVQLVKSYFSAVAGFTEPEAVTQVDVQARKDVACPLGALQLTTLLLCCACKPPQRVCCNVRPASHTVSACTQARTGSPLQPALAALGRLWQRSQQDPFYGVISYRNFKRVVG